MLSLSCKKRKDLGLGVKWWTCVSTNSLWVLGKLIYPPRHSVSSSVQSDSQRSWLPNVHNLYDWYHGCFHLEKAAATRLVGNFVLCQFKRKLQATSQDYLPCMVPGKDWPHEISVRLGRRRWNKSHCTLKVSILLGSEGLCRVAACPHLAICAGLLFDFWPCWPSRQLAVNSRRSQWLCTDTYPAHLVVSL